MGSSRVTVLVGGQFGDEGKGKFVHYLVQKEGVDVVARGNGGPNAGHNVHDPARNLDIALHLLPSGIASEKTVNIVGCGTVINPYSLVEEMEAVTKAGISLTPDNLKLSSRAHLILQSHRIIDGAKDRVGTTGQGIGPAYRDKASRLGLRLESIMRPTFKDEVREALIRHNKELEADGVFDLCLDIEKEVVRFTKAAAQIRPYIFDTVEFLDQSLRAGKSILAEGAQATLLDINHGTYPYVTSSGATAGGVVSGIGVPAHYANRVIGVFKLPMTRVGKGPFVTKLTKEEQILHATLAGRKGAPGAEFGATTGRARDIGWMDLLAARYAQVVNGFTEIGLTKLDALTGIGTLKIATAYECDGEVVTVMPGDAEVLARCRPVYTELPGWDVSIAGVREYDALPKAAKEYVTFVETEVGVPVTMIGTGPNNDDIIIRNEK